TRRALRGRHHGRGPAQLACPLVERLPLPLLPLRRHAAAARLAPRASPAAHAAPLRGTPQTSDTPPTHLPHTSSTPPPDILHTSSTPPPRLLGTSLRARRRRGLRAAAAKRRGGGHAGAAAAAAVAQGPERARRRARPVPHLVLAASRRAPADAARARAPARAAGRVLRAAAAGLFAPVRVLVLRRARRRVVRGAASVRDRAQGDRHLLRQEALLVRRWQHPRSLSRPRALPGVGGARCPGTAASARPRGGPPRGGG
ncbi:Hypothetical protein EMIHUDRAFT_444078, partial [Emiliania huxleyi CCMP1516]